MRGEVTLSTDHVITQRSVNAEQVNWLLSQGSHTHGLNNLVT